MNDLILSQKILLCEDLLNEELHCGDPDDIAIHKLIDYIIDFKNQRGRKRLTKDLLNEIAKGLSGVNK